MLVLRICASDKINRCYPNYFFPMNYELTEECYEILLKDYNEWADTYYQLFGADGISGNEINVM